MDALVSPTDDALGGPNPVGARPLLALFDVKADRFAAAQVIKVERGIDAALMKEVLLAIFSSDEPETPIRDDLFDSAFRHSDFPPLEQDSRRVGPFERQCGPHVGPAQSSGGAAVLYHTVPMSTRLAPHGPGLLAPFPLGLAVRRVVAELNT